MVYTGKIKLTDGREVPIVYLSPSEYQRILDQDKIFLERFKQSDQRCDTILGNLIRLSEISKDALAPYLAELLKFRLKGYNKPLKWTQIMAFSGTDYPISLISHDAIRLLVKEGFFKVSKNGWYRINETS